MTKIYKVLIVENEFINRKFTEQLLINLGHDIVASVTNAKDALLITKNKIIDFIFMDINLEGSINGIDCAKQLNKNIPIIYMTEKQDRLSIEKASQTNIYGYLIKPFSSQEFRATLSVAIVRLQVLNREKISTIELGAKYSYELKSKTLKKENKPIVLTKKEHDVLNFFVVHLNEQVSFYSLKESIWENKQVSVSTIRDTVLRLRKKAPLLKIENFVGIGYCLKNL